MYNRNYNRSQSNYSKSMRNGANVEKILCDNKGLKEALEFQHVTGSWADRTVADINARFRRWGNISEKQIALVFRLVSDAMAPKQETGEPIPANLLGKRITIEGEILSCKLKSTDYGDTFKITVADDRGFKVWGTLPGNLTAYDAEQYQIATVSKGDRIRLQAKIKASPSDPAFGFYSRPSKAEKL